MANTLHGTLTRSLAPLLAAGVLLAMLATAAALAPSSAEAAKNLGRTAQMPRPECPRDTRAQPCQAIGSVTGFQHTGGGRQGLMRAREDGFLVAWGIRLSRPNADQRAFFGDFFEHTRFGPRPTARIAVLRRMASGQFRLMRQSPVAELNGVLGSAQIFTLNSPLRIRQGQFLALTVPSWAPAFAVNLPAAGNVWRASRPANRCMSERDLRNSRPHQNEGSDRAYGCAYRTARLLYWGLYSPDE